MLLCNFSCHDADADTNIEFLNEDRHIIVQQLRNERGMNVVGADVGNDVGVDVDDNIGEVIASCDEL